MKEIIRDSFCLEYEKGVVSIVEIMGRNAGWLTGSKALSQGEDCEGPDLIYLPELPFDLQLFGEKIRQLLQEKTSIVVAVSEGIRTADGTYVCELGNSIDFVMHSDTNSYQELHLIWRVILQVRSDVRHVRLN